MINFNKEELELILSDLNHAVFSRYYRTGMAEIRHKALSMIDQINKQESCEHEWGYQFNDDHCLKCERRK